MKTLTIIGALFLLLTLSAPIKAQVGIGLKFGPTINTMLGNGADAGSWDKKPPKLGLLFGTVVNIHISDRLSFQPELLIYQRGVGYRDSGYKLRLNLTYLELPLLFQIKFGENKVKGFMNVGPSIGILTGGKLVSADPDGDRDTGRLSSFYGGTENRIDIGLSLGGGVAIELGPGDLTIEPRFIIGLIDTDSDPDYTIRNFSTGIHLGYVYYFGK